MESEDALRAAMRERMTLDDAQHALGHYVALNAHGGQWVTGRLVGIATTPQLFIDHEDGSRGVYTLDTVDGWAMSAQGFPPTDTDADVCRNFPYVGKVDASSTEDRS